MKKITIQKNELTVKLQKLNPALNGFIQVKTNDGKLVFETVSPEMQAQVIIGKIDFEIECSLDSSFVGMVNKMPNKELTLEFKNDNLIIKCDLTKVKLAIVDSNKDYDGDILVKEINNPYLNTS